MTNVSVSQVNKLRNAVPLGDHDKTQTQNMLMLNRYNQELAGHCNSLPKFLPPHPTGQKELHRAVMVHVFFVCRFRFDMHSEINEHIY